MRVRRALAKTNSAPDIGSRRSAGAAANANTRCGDSTRTRNGRPVGTSGQEKGSPEDPQAGAGRGSHTSTRTRTHADRGDRIGQVGTETRDGPHSRDNHPVRHDKPPSTAITWRVT